MKSYPPPEAMAPRHGASGLYKNIASRDALRIATTA